MTAVPAAAPSVIDQEFVVHLFAPLAGPQAAAAYQQIQRLWTACAEQLGIAAEVTGFPGVLPSALAQVPPDGFTAVRENPVANRYCVLRRVHDVLNLSLAIAQPVPEGLRPGAGAGLRPVRSASEPQRRLGWTDFGQIWAQVSAHCTDSMLGEARLYLARTPPGQAAANGYVAATAELGLFADSLLPYRLDRPADWWRYGTNTEAGFAVWDTRLVADTNAVREIVLLAAADQDAQLSGWAWSDGSARFPPLARYLLHAAKLRFEARLLDAWKRDTSPGDVDQVIAELTAALATADVHSERSELLRSRLSRLRAEETRMASLQAEFARLAETVTIARDNLLAIPGCGAGSDTTGMFAADQALAGWLTGQVEHDLRYLRIEAERVSGVRALATEELQQSQRAEPVQRLAADANEASRAPARAAAGASASDRAAQDGTDIARRVFVVHGRDGVLVGRFRDLLRAMNLEPLEWETLVEAMGSTAPYLGQVVARAPHLARATLVLLSPDDIVELHPDLCQGNDHLYEQARSGQARPNVYFELGQALMAYPERTIVVEIGELRPVADLAGLNVIRFDGSSPAIKKVLDRLKQAGCAVVDSGADWLDASRFGDLTAYSRGPASGAAGG